MISRAAALCELARNTLGLAVLLVAIVLIAVIAWIGAAAWTLGRLAKPQDVDRFHVKHHKM